MHLVFMLYAYLLLWGQLEKGIEISMVCMDFECVTTELCKWERAYIRICTTKLCLSLVLFIIFCSVWCSPDIRLSSLCGEVNVSKALWAAVTTYLWALSLPVICKVGLGAMQQEPLVLKIAQPPRIAGKSHSPANIKRQKRHFGNQYWGYSSHF